MAQRRDDRDGFTSAAGGEMMVVLLDVYDRGRGRRRKLGEVGSSPPKKDDKEALFFC